MPIPSNPADFPAWLAELVRQADRLDYPVDTALDMWRDYYDLEFSPDDALIEDMVHADWWGVEPAPER